MHKDGWNVATSQRRDVPTSRRWVNIYRSQQVATSRCLNIVTSQHRNVTTSRRQRELCLSIIKSKRGPEFKEDERLRTYKLGHIDHGRTLTLEKSHHFFIFFFSDRKTNVL